MQCKYCLSELQDGAIKCKYCGEFIDNKYKSNDAPLYRTMFQGSAKIFCPQCEYEGTTSKLGKKGNIWITILLLFVGIIPGMIYELWRGQLYFICPKCKNNHINKID